MTAPAEAAYREHWSRLLALLTGELRSLEVAEEALAAAFEKAVATWGRDGVPDRPGAWLLTVARRAAADAFRRAAVARRKLPLLVVPDGADAEPVDTGVIGDDRLRLVFTCCHPALAPAARVALTLRYVAGLRTGEIARLFLVSEATMAARLTRAKRKLSTAGVPYRVPGPGDLAGRAETVLTVVYLVFTEGYRATEGPELVRPRLCAEAIRLGRLLHRLLPGFGDAAAVLALMVLQHARRDARVDAAGLLVPLAGQDRRRWRRDEIDAGLELLNEARRGPVTRWTLEASIAAGHATAAAPEDTDWRRIAGLYGLLEAITSSPVVRLNRAVAVAEAEGPAAGLRLLDGLDEALPGHHLLPAARAELHRRLGHAETAARHYTYAIALARTDAERDWMRSRRAGLA